MLLLLKTLIEDIKQYDLKEIHKIIQILSVCIGAPFFTLIDSPWVSEYYQYGQEFDNVVMLLFYCWFLFTAERKLFWLMIAVTMSGYCAEIIGSTVLGLYHYRLHNIPIYIPLGHGALYATVYNFTRLKLVWPYHALLESFFRQAIFLICFISLLVLHDIFGFACFILYLLLTLNRKKPLFYLTMFFFVYCTEFCGITFAGWSWYQVNGNYPDFPSVANNPCGIGGLYVTVDVISNAAYLMTKKFKHSLKKASFTKRLLTAIGEKTSPLPQARDV